MLTNGQFHTTSVEDISRPTQRSWVGEAYSALVTVHVLCAAWKSREPLVNLRCAQDPQGASPLVSHQCNLISAHSCALLRLGSGNPTIVTALESPPVPSHQSPSPPTP